MFQQIGHPNVGNSNCSDKLVWLANKGTCQPIPRQQTHHKGAAILLIEGWFWEDKISDFVKLELKTLKKEAIWVETKKTDLRKIKFLIK